MSRKRGQTKSTEEILEDPLFTIERGRRKKRRKKEAPKPLVVPHPSKYREKLETREVEEMKRQVESIDRRRIQQ